MQEQDEKKPPEGGFDEVGKIEVILQRNGQVRLRGSLLGKFNSSTASMHRRYVTSEVAFQLGELSAEWHMRRMPMPDQPAAIPDPDYRVVTV